MSRCTQVPIGFAAAHLTQLRELADRRGVSLAHVVRAAVAAYLVDPDADLRRQMQGPAPQLAPQPVVMTPQPAQGIWRRPVAPLAPTA